MNPPELAVSPFVQSRDDFFYGPPDSVNVSPLIAANGVLPLHDDVAVPACTDHALGRACRLHGYDFVVLFVQGDSALLQPSCAGTTDADSTTPILSEIEPPNGGGSILVPGHRDDREPSA